MDPSGDLQEALGRGRGAQSSPELQHLCEGPGVAVGPEGVSASSSLATLAGDSRSENSFCFLTLAELLFELIFPVSPFFVGKQVPGHRLTLERTAKTLVNTS